MNKNEDRIIAEKDGSFTINVEGGTVKMNEPVAWIDPKELDMDVSTSVTKTKQFDGDIPLYTHPVKELTDEEIGQIWKDCMESPYMQVSNPVGFARAVLKKARE
jgi:hypothetical protein